MDYNMTSRPQIARQSLDRRLAKLGKVADWSRPQRGWVRAIRDALGMTSAQLAARMKVSQPNIIQLEQAEAKGTITLDSLERAAQALGCRLVYALVPEKPLEQIVEAQALQAAREQLRATRHSMALEAQSLASEDDQDMIKRLARDIAEAGGRKLWGKP
jgi:predicted DNA-binding mobile mystery protein A